MNNEIYTEQEMEEMRKLNDRPVREGIVYKCKPTYQFQSIEFEIMAPLSEEGIKKVAAAYKQVLDELIKISPEQNQKGSVPSKPLATDKQKDIMRKFGIPFTDKTTTSDAQALIKESMDKCM